MFASVTAVLRGLVLNPPLVAFARGLVESVVFLVLYSIADYALTLPDVSPLLLMAMPLLIRTGEGFVDKIDPAKQRRRDELRAAAVVAASDDSVTEINHGDVVDPAVSG